MAKRFRPRRGRIRKRFTADDPVKLERSRAYRRAISHIRAANLPDSEERCERLQARLRYWRLGHTAALKAHSKDWRVAKNKALKGLRAAANALRVPGFELDGDVIAWLLRKHDYANPFIESHFAKLASVGMLPYIFDLLADNLKQTSDAELQLIFGQSKFIALARIDTRHFAKRGGGNEQGAARGLLIKNLESILPPFRTKTARNRLLSDLSKLTGYNRTPTQVGDIFDDRKGTRKRRTRGEIEK